ncbi:MAG TPA: hypothetical protein VLV54_01980 [Thermoanaerobaculia bacterium]|nr:hypothetical protein [Thermoanaerobaculia bacterium]
MITVSEASPLVAERSIAVDPWALLQSTPGVLVDRITVGGNESGCSSRAPVMEDAAALGKGFLDVNEVIATDLAVAGSLPGELDFNAFAEIPVETLDAGATPGTPEVPARLRPRRGTDEWQAAGSFQGSGGGEGAGETDRVDSQVANVWVGGPLLKDRLWAWGEAGHHGVDSTVLGGQREEQTGRSGRFKLNAQIGLNVSTVLAGSHGLAAGSGIGAGPARAPETTWKEDGREDIWAAEGTAIVTSDFYWTASLGSSHRRLGDRPPFAGMEARIGPDGVARGSWFGFREEDRTRQARLGSSVFANALSTAHEITFGAGWRGQDENRTLTSPGALVTAGGILGLADGLALAELWRSGETGARTGELGLWVQDTLSAGAWTVIAGLQGDRQDLGIAGGGRPWALLPRFELNRSLDRDRMTQAWISLGRFASRLGPRAAWHLDPQAPAALREVFADRNGDLSREPDEPVRLLLPGEGLDLLRPGINPNAVDPRLRPEITDQAAFGLQRALTRDFQIGLRATWRRTRDLLDERLLVRDGATGRVFTATAGDWIPAGQLTGVLPGGTAYDAPVWDLRPGLLWTGGTLLVNGDRRQESLGLSLTWRKTLSNRWMTQGHLTWRDGNQQLGPAFRRFDDPTNTLGSGDDEGRPVTMTASGRPHEIPGFQGARWSFHALGFVELRDGLNLSAAVNGRQGDPLPYYRQVARERAGLALVQLTDRPDTLRTDAVLTLDSRLEKEITLGDAVLTLSLEAANLLNTGTVLERELDLATGRGALADETLASRSFRMQVRMAWR